MMQIRAVFRGGDGANLTDGQLLERFATRDGEAAGWHSRRWSNGTGRWS